jgi:ribonuclease-3
MADLTELEETLNITFKDKTLLQRALTHSSYLNENPVFLLEDNERLEFLGDALLDFITGEHLYHRFPEMREGQLTSLRAALVRTETLARFASQLELGRYLLLGRGEDESGGRERQATLCAVFEALMGAMYLDQGLKTTVDFITTLITPEIKRVLQARLDKDAKSLLQELSQALFQLTPVYRTVAEAGPDHAKEVTVEVLIGHKVCGRGVGRSKQAAEQEAARAALEQGFDHDQAQVIPS